MFGVVPKTIWQRLIPADENNLIPMVTNLFVLKAHGKTMIFDCGLGDTLTDREKKVYGTTGASRLESSLAELGLKTGDIDGVILTHLHTDHAGGAVKKDNGGFAPRFQNARYIINRREWEQAINPDERTKAVYIPERLTVLERAGQVDFIDGNTELFPGIRAVMTGGHTASHFALEMESDGTAVFYYADIYCTSHHMKTAYVPATDLYPLQTMDIKRRVLPRIVNRDVIMAFDHDVVYPLARIKERDGKIFAEPVTDRQV
ncbi:MAG: MBL fold metallo-hydrolase [Candidatus Zixiibacteriota bacterium]